MARSTDLKTPSSSDGINSNIPDVLILAPPSPLPNPEPEIIISTDSHSCEDVAPHELLSNGKTITQHESNVTIVPEYEFAKPFLPLPDFVTQYETTTTATSNGIANEAAKLTPKSVVKTTNTVSSTTTTTLKTPGNVGEDDCDSSTVQQVQAEILIPVTPISNVKSGASNGFSKGTMNGKTAAARNGQNVIDLLTASPANPPPTVSSITNNSNPNSVDNVKYCNSIINPVIDQLTTSSSTLKMLTKLIERQTSNVVLELLPKLMPKLVEAYDSPDITVRKGAVFAMVAIYKSVGELPVSPYLTSLTDSKKKLLRLYIERSDPPLTSHSNTHSTIKNQSATTTTTTSTATHHAPAQVPLASKILCPGNNDTNDH